MLATFRRSLATWPVRLFFGLLVLSFGLWGVADVVRNIGHASAVASVAGESIELPELQEAYRRQLAQTARMLGNTTPTPEIRRMVALQAVEQLVTQKALAAAAHDLGVTVPDSALSAAIEQISQFHNGQGQYDANLAREVLRNNGLNERAFGDLLRTQITDSQVMGAVMAGAAAPAVMADKVFAFQQEKRTADAVVVPLAAAPAPPAPTDAQLERWWANHPEKYSTPEFRRVKAIVLAPSTLASEIQVTDDDLKGEWEQHKAAFSKPERRSVQVILTQDHAEAEHLASEWQAGADWAAMQKAADKSGAAPVELSDATRAEFPAPELGDAVFATPLDVVPPPVHSALGWHVLKVVKIDPGGSKTFEEARDDLRKRVIDDKAADLIYDRANRIETLLSSGTTLDTLPGDLGVAAVTGSLDAQGNALGGEPAPIPGPPELRKAFIEAAFAAKLGDAPKLVQAPNAAGGAQSFFALTLEKIDPPAPKPLAEVTEQVRADWEADQKRHEQEEVAARIYSALKGGFTLAAAAEKAGLPVKHLPATGREQPAEGVPPPLLAPLFGLKQGEAVMVEIPDGFVVAVLTGIEQPPPSADPVGFQQIRAGLARAVGQDIEQVYATAVRDRAHPHVNEAAVASLSASPAE